MKYKILIADDAEFNRDILKEILGETHNYLKAETAQSRFSFRFFLFSAGI